VAQEDLEKPSLRELARVIKAGACIEASFQRGKGEAGMDAYQVRPRCSPHGSRAR